MTTTMGGPYKIGGLTVEAIQRDDGWAIRLQAEKQAIYFRELDEDRARTRAAVLAGMLEDEKAR